MKRTTTEAAHGLKPGQLWQADGAYVQIVELGKRLIHYKMLKHPNQKAVLTRMIGIEALLAYLKNTEATLVSSPG